MPYRRPAIGPSCGDPGTPRLLGSFVSVYDRHCERKRSNPSVGKGSMDCFVASLLAMTVDTPPHSRDAFRPDFANRFAQGKRGRRECRVLAAPAVSRAKMHIESAHEHTGTVGAVRHSPHNGLTAYAVLSSPTNSSCHRHRRIEGLVAPGWVDIASADLTPATGAGTTRFCRTQPPVFAKRLRRALAPFVCHAGRPLTDKSPPCDPVRARRCRVHRISPRRV